MCGNALTGDIFIDRNLIRRRDNVRSTCREALQESLAKTRHLPQGFGQVHVSSVILKCVSIMLDSPLDRREPRLVMIDFMDKFLLFFGCDKVLPQGQAGHDDVARDRGTFGKTFVVVGRRRRVGVEFGISHDDVAISDGREVCLGLLGLGNTGIRH